MQDLRCSQPFLWRFNGIIRSLCVHMYTVITWSQLTELSMKVWSCKAIELRTPSLQIITLRCKISGAHSHFYEDSMASSGHYVSIYTVITWSQLTELSMNVWSCKAIELRTPSLQIMTLRCKISGAHSHFYEDSMVSSGYYVSIYTVITWSQLTELSMNVWSCKAIELRTPSLQIMTLRCKISGAHSHFYEESSLPGHEAVPAGISMECVVPTVQFWKVHFLHFLNPEDGGTKPLRSVIFTNRQGFKPIRLLYSKNDNCTRYASDKTS